MLKKVLVANRGEIAVRVMRTCREMGLGVVAVYSEADAVALHVQMADEAYPIGPALARESYLCIDRLIDAAKRSKCDAIHPGYGFLSENAELAQAAKDNGITFIGPEPASIRSMGDKTVARKTMADAGVPLVPGENGAGGRGFADAAAALVAADRLGFPVMIKAAAGGGGKGMRLCVDRARLERDFDSARREAKAAFGDDAVYLEKFIAQPRHVEVQVFGDRHGNAVHLFERDCSIQRRHQKVIEEAPSPAVDADLRSRMGEVAVQAVRSIGYLGAGTMEFLLGADGNFYFLEMNTRLQVEHPITEWITGLDLVRWQLQVASGEPLPLKQEQIPQRGHAMEFRVYAEDPVRFLPSPGKIAAMREPGGPGVRVDSGVEAGAEITPYYDPLIAKLSVWHETRALALGRAARALDEYLIAGTKTNLPLHRAVVRNPAFIAGRYDTGFLEAQKDGLPMPSADGERLDLLVASAALATAQAESAGATTTSPHGEPRRSAWRRAFS